MTDQPTATPGAGPGAHGNQAFATTHWSLVVQAADCGTADGRAALAELCRVYWYPLYGFARRRGHSEDDAKDLTQGFFAKLLQEGAVARADAARGRFRTYLLAMFEHYRAHEHARATSQKRGSGYEVVSLEMLQGAESRFQEEPASTNSPERIFDYKWAMSLLEQTLEAVRHEYVVVGKAALFGELHEVLWGSRGDVSYAEIARRLGSTEGAFKLAVHRVRRRFREQLRVEVAKTLVLPQEVDDELRHLFSALGAYPPPGFRE
jgi:RNA polymerase sigma-70 factor (ECF subfamily)